MVKIKTVHKISLVFVILIIQVIVIASVIFLSQEIVLVRYELNQTKQELINTINLNKIETQSQIKELSETVSETEKSLTKQFSKLKAQTSADFSGIVSDVAKSVVTVKTDIAQGSGFIISEDGYIATNVHILNMGRYIKVLTYNNKIYDADLIGYDTKLDIAVLKITGNFDYLEFGNSDEINIGEKVIAIGNPLGLSFSVTEGIVSGVHRTGPQGLAAYIQTDTPLNPGNSGGPLINTQGKVIGINSLKIRGSENLGFALESNYARETINEILEQVEQQTNE